MILNIVKTYFSREMFLRRFVIFGAHLLTQGAVKLKSFLDYASCHV